MAVEPVARRVRNSREQVRRHLQVAEDDGLVLVTMGGVQERTIPLDRIRTQADRHLVFVVPGDEQGRIVREDNLLRLPRNSALYHPDLVASADVVIGKVGYSTVAEVYQAAIPFGYTCRQEFPESPPLASFIRSRMEGQEILEDAFQRGDWIMQVPELIARQTAIPPRSNGADRIAAYVAALLQESQPAMRSGA